MFAFRPSDLIFSPISNRPQLHPQLNYPSLLSSLFHQLYIFGCRPTHSLVISVPPLRSASFRGILHNLRRDPPELGQQSPEQADPEPSFAIGTNLDHLSLYSRHPVHYQGGHRLAGRTIEQPFANFLTLSDPSVPLSETPLT